MLKTLCKKRTQVDIIRQLVFFLIKFNIYLIRLFARRINRLRYFVLPLYTIQSEISEGVSVLVIGSDCIDEIFKGAEAALDKFVKDGFLKFVSADWNQAVTDGGF